MKTKTQTAAFIRNLDNFTGDARLYKLDPPMSYEGWDDETDKNATTTTEWVVVSATVAPYSGAETYIFPSNAEGEITSWGELDGSFRGALDHAEALANADYKVVGS